MYDKHGSFSAGQSSSVGNQMNADVMRYLINLKSETMLRGDKGTIIMPTGSLDIRFDVPNTTSFTPDKIVEGSKGSLKKLDTFAITGSLDKYANVFQITHETIARGIADAQTQMSMNAAAKGLAIQRDTNIFTALNAGVGSTAAAPDTWDDPNGLADPATDIANAIGSILENTYMTEDESNSLSVFIPAGMFPHLGKPMDINGTIQTVQRWAEDQYKVNFIYTRALDTNALVVVKSQETAIHLDYNGSAVPMSYVTEDSVGTTYEMMNYFKTIIMADADGGTTTKNIYSITDVATTTL